MKKTQSEQQEVEENQETELVGTSLTQIEDIQKQIANVIVASSVDMVKSVVRGVKRRGSVVGLRFLWSIAGILPRQVAAGSDESALSMKTLAEKLGLYEKPSDSCATLDEHVK
jgi:hypothetical protein